MFDIPTATWPHAQFSEFTLFMTTKGTLYSFFPSLLALVTLAG